MEAIQRERPQVTVADKEFLTTDEMAAWMDVSPNTLRKWRLEGLPYYNKSDKIVYYSKTDMVKFMNNFKEGA